MPALTRRWICRALFISLALVPTFLIGILAAWAHTQRTYELRQNAWKQRILQESGLLGSAERMQQGDRGDVILENFSLIDPETERELAAIRRVHAAPAGERGWVVEASYPMIASDQLLRLWTPIYDRLRQSRGTSDWSGLITARNVTLRDQQSSQTLSQLECQFGSSDSGAFAKVEFLVAGLGMSRRAELVVARDRSLENPETFVVFNTGPLPLPCSLAYAALPGLAHLGQDCRFVGQVKLRLNEQDGWRGEELNGRLENIDFATLITDLFPHHLLTGSGTLNIRRAVFQNGRLVAAEGEVHCENGRISRSLLESATEHLNWSVADSVSDTSDSRIPFAEMHFDFRLDESGLVLHGKCGEPHVIMLGATGPLAWESGEATPVTNFLSVLVPDSTHQVPATQQTSWLAGMLPVPSIRPTRTAIRPSSPALRFSEQR